METMGLIFSRIQVTNAKGDPPKPLGLDEGKQNMGSQVKNFK